MRTYLLLFLLFLFIACSSIQSHSNISYDVKQPTIQFQKTFTNQTNTSETTSEYILQQNPSTTNYPNDFSHNPTERTLAQEWSSNNCEGTGNKTLISPIPPEELELITPLGAMIGAHVTPIDHQYWSPKNTNEQGNRKTPVDVLAPASGYVVSIQHMVEFIGDKQNNMPNVDDYRLILEHSCTFYTYFIHVKTISQKILMEFENNRGGQRYAQTRIPITQGEVIGTIFRSVDFAAIDTTKKLGFIIPEHYTAEPWKINTVDPFDYFSEPLRTQLLAKNPRTANPRGGKIDYDIDGTLIGNWFLQGTNGYFGKTQYEYWRGHIAFAYDPFDPNAIILSIGDYEGTAKQFAVKGNAPDPATIGIENETVKFELAQVEYLTNENHWNRLSFATNIRVTTTNSKAQGVLLAKLLSNRTIKVEVFPHASIRDPLAFTSHSKVYER